MSKEKILVIEDDANLREAICTFIEINGLDFVSAANGKEGLLCLTSQVVDMVVCDINLPDVLGWEILKAVRNDPRIYNIPFIFLSAYADKKDVNKGLELGADEYITKPFSNKELIETIFFWLKRAKRDDNLLAQDLNAKVLNLIGRNMSHDIIEPLFGLLSEGRVLNQYQGLPAHNHLAETDVINHQMNSILSIYASGFHIQRDLNNYVTYESLVNSKTKELVNDKFTVNLDLAVLLNKIVATYNTIYNQEMLAVETSSLYNWKGSEKHINIIFTELIDNAIKFNIGTSKPELSLTKGANNGFIFTISNRISSLAQFSASDIAAFTKFQKDESISGLGLGLFVSKTLCDYFGYSFSMDIKDSIVTISVASL